jgi:hypothetical protein
LSDAIGSTDNKKQKKALPAASWSFFHAADFFREVSSFRGRTDMRLALSTVLKELGLSEEAPVLSSLTEPEIETVLAGVCRLLSDESASPGKDEGP